VSFFQHLKNNPCQFTLSGLFSRRPQSSRCTKAFLVLFHCQLEPPTMARSGRLFSFAVEGKREQYEKLKAKFENQTTKETASHE
jgi:hypothetical protein